MAQSKDETPVAGLAKMREPFTPNHISKLPKESRAQIDERKSNRASAINCSICGGWHHKNAVHLDYVGHAALTDRLLDCDISWSWEPVALTPEGLPAFDRTGGLWIRLTVAGVTRLGYGSADGKQGGDAVKEIIGDAMRNAAMRFGAALDLWHKGDLRTSEDDEPASLSAADWALLVQLIETTETNLQALCEAYKVSSIKELTPPQYADAKGILEKRLAKMVPQDAKPKGEGLSDLLEDEIPY